MKKCIFICLVGIDGSGKTTIAKTLERNLIESGVSSKYAWCGWRCFDSFLFGPIARLAKSIFRSKKRNLSVDNNAQLLGSLVLLDYILSLSGKIFLSLYRYDVFIADRYIYDLLVGFMVTNSKITGLQRRLLMLFPKPDIIFFIDVPPEVAFNRKNDVPSMEYLIKRKKAYLEILNLHEAKRLDGTSNLDELLNIILMEINKCPKSQS